ARKGIDAVFIRLCRPLSAAVQVAGGNCGAGDGSAGGVGDVACQTCADFLSQRRADKCKFGKKNGKKVSTQGSASHVGGYYTSIHACVEHAHPGRRGGLKPRRRLKPAPHSGKPQMAESLN